MDKNNSFSRSSDANAACPPSYGSAFAEFQNNRLQQATFTSNCMPSSPPHSSLPSSSYYSYGSVQSQPTFNRQNAHCQYQIQHYQQESEPPQRYRFIIRRVGREDRHFPVNAALFTLGWLFPPLWFIGCCWKSQNIYENAWRKANICMTILSLIAFTFFVVFMTLLMLEERQNLPPTNSGDLPDLPPM
ncbi:hypothetical protein BD408DRAFT_418056 [Parasitella parasitica]|nr:hypothetical protein BD408DRAFT_418056 [Parasitella parasitica]